MPSKPLYPLPFTLSPGYTAVIFATSLCAGLIKATRQILGRSEVVMRSGGLALVLMGVYYVISGVLWFL